MSSPADRKYLTTHEWHKLEGNTVTLGISRFAVDELTDVTYVALPKIGTACKAGGSIGEIESVKATSEIYTGVSGKIVAVNDEAAKNPSVINQDPFGAGWLVKIEATNPAELSSLLDAAAYDAKYPAH
jgi:glycine cleavage system H protein